MHTHLYSFGLLALGPSIQKTKKGYFDKPRQLQSYICNRPNEVITNILLRVQIEQAAHDVMDDRDESHVKKLSKAVGPRPNSVFSNALMVQFETQYQAHLEQISDFLLPSEGVWWKHGAQGVEFLDGEDEEMNTRIEPKLMHYRGQSLPDVELYLEKKWEECICSRITVPASSVKYYTHPEPGQIPLNRQPEQNQAAPSC